MSAVEKAWEILEGMGLVWPDADEGKLRDAARAWRAFEKDVREVRRDTDNSARRILEVNSGEAAEAFEKFWSQYVGRGDNGWLRDLPESAKDMAKVLDELADDVDSTKRQIRSEIVGSAALIAAGIVLTGPTFGMSDVAAGAAATAIVSLSVEKSASLATRAASLFARIARGAVIAGVSNVTMDLAVAQPARIIAGRQDGFSLQQVSDAAKYGTLTGAVLGPFTPGAGATPPALRPPASLRERLIPASARPAKETPVKGEPVDVATGAMLMEQTDLTLPASLPLLFTRTHLSSYRAGVCFGPTWTSTLDEQVQLDARGVVFAASDGMRLSYPIPEPEVPVLPESGPRWPLEWDGKPDGVMTVTDPDTGVLRTFAHPGPTEDDATVRLPVESWQDRNGARIEVDRNTEGVPTAVRHSGGYHLAVESEGHRVTALRLLDEAPSPYEPQGPEHPRGTLVARYGYDEAGNLAEVVNSSGEALRFTYDASGRMLEWRDRNDVWFRYEYDEAGRVVRTRGVDGIYDGTFTYDDAERATVYTDSHSRRTVCHHDVRGKVVAETDPLGHTTRTLWNDRGTDPLSVTDPLGRTTHYTYDAGGSLTSVTLPDGSCATATYNALRQPLSVTEPGGSQWRHAYDDLGNLTRTTDPSGATTAYGYDERGHLTTVTDALGHTREIVPGPAGLPASVTDALGHTTRVSRDTFGRVTEITDPLGHVTRMEWTPEGLPCRREDPAGGSESWTWDGEGNLLTHTDPAGHTTHHAPAPFDVPATRTEPDGATYAFAYDTEMRLTTVTNPQGLHWRYAYDAAGRLVSETDFNGATRTYALDAAGQLVARTNAAGQTLRYTRDALGDITAQQEETPDGERGPETTYAYDAAGALIRATSHDAELTLTRDPMGRVLTETVNGATMAYAYDALGRCTRRTTPSGLTSTWTYDAEDRPLELSTEHGSLTFLHDAAGRETERRCGALVLRQEWDAADRLITQTARTGRVANPDRGTKLLQHRAYTYRPDSYLTEISELASGTRHFTLDPTGRVTGVSAHGWRETYAYDTAGNVTTAEAPQHEAPGDRDVEGTLLHRAGRTTYAYDAAGRRTSTCRRLLNGQTRTWTYTWNAEDRLTRAVTPEGTWTYTYDPLGRRLTKTGPDGTGLAFAWDGTRVAEQTTPGGTTTTWDYAPGTHRPLAQTDHTPLVRPQGGGSLLTKLAAEPPVFHAVLTDLTGTPTELVTPEGSITWQPRTTLWGTPLPGPTAHPGAVACPLRFPGQYADPETGLHYNYFRYYDPATARYLTPDPLGLGPAPNPDVYVGNPLSWGDPLGLESCLGAGQARAEVSSGKLDYLFNKNIKTDSHNSPRAVQNELQLNRIGIRDSEEMRGYVKGHLEKAARQPFDRTFTKEWEGGSGKFGTTDSVMHGPHGALGVRSTWQLEDDGRRRLTTVIFRGSGPGVSKEGSLSHWPPYNH